MFNAALRILDFNASKREDLWRIASGRVPNPTGVVITPLFRKPLSDRSYTKSFLWQWIHSPDARIATTSKKPAILKAPTKGTPIPLKRIPDIRLPDGARRRVDLFLTAKSLPGIDPYGRPVAGYRRKYYHDLPKAELAHYVDTGYQWTSNQTNRRRQAANPLRKI